VKINAKGQVTIPVDICRAHGLKIGDEVEVVVDGGTLRVGCTDEKLTRGQRLVGRMRGCASTSSTADELMKLLRGD